MKVIIIDERTDFLNYVKNRLSVCDDLDVEVIGYLADMSTIDDYLDKADLALIADNIASDPDFKYPSMDVYGYETSDEYSEALYQADMENVGRIVKPRDMVDFIYKLEDDGSCEEEQPKPVKEKPSKPERPYRPDSHDNSKGVIRSNTPRSARKQMSSSRNPRRYEEEYEEDCYEDDDEYDEDAEETARRKTMDSKSPQKSRQASKKPTEPAISDFSDDIPEKAKVITVYSAKGGVGKTTLASEIGAYLALTCKKRGRLRCCVIDYNIDFGDVTTTLGFDAEGVNMAMWASEIEERRTQGKSTDYTAKEIQENYLQRKVFDDKTEIFGLIAPPTHEDSMDIHEEELFIMLDNIVRNGGFDYVICDTGNNTRDSSIIALDFADYVFMVLTQDISTINCNDSFLTTIRRMKYDESRIRVVINNVLPSKETAISVHDIESFVSFPTAAIIRHHSDVIKANNQSVPLVFRASHEYTKEIRNIISVIINDGEVVADSKKGHSLFKRNAGGSEKKRVRR